MGEIPRKKDKHEPGKVVAKPAQEGYNLIYKYICAYREDTKVSFDYEEETNMKWNKVLALAMTGALSLGLLSAEEFDDTVRPEKMV